MPRRADFQKSRSPRVSALTESGLPFRPYFGNLLEFYWLNFQGVYLISGAGQDSKLKMSRFADFVISKDLCPYGKWSPFSVVFWGFICNLPTKFPGPLTLGQTTTDSLWANHHHPLTLGKPPPAHSGQTTTTHSGQTTTALRLNARTHLP